MKLNDKICKMPPWFMAEISRDIFDALEAMGLGERTIEKLHYELMGMRLKDAAEYVDVKRYLG